MLSAIDDVLDVKRAWKVWVESVQHTVNDRTVLEDRIKALRSAIAGRGDDLVRIFNSREGSRSLKVPTGSKSLARAQGIRERANAAYADTRWMEALSLYTEALAVAPSDSNEHALALSDRSATLNELQKLEECLQDIDRALNLPEHARTVVLTAKLLKRRATYLLSSPSPGIKICGATPRQHPSITALEEALALLTVAAPKDSEAAKWMKRIETDLKETKRTIMRDKRQPWTPNTSKSTTARRTLDAGVRVERTPFAGRGLISTKPLSPPLAILEEPPYAALSVSDTCSYCLHDLPLNPIPCKLCSSEMYCGGPCQVAAWEAWHHVECELAVGGLGVSAFLRVAPPHVRLGLRGFWRWRAEMSHGEKAPAPTDDSALDLTPQWTSLWTGLSELVSQLNAASSLDLNHPDLLFESALAAAVVAEISPEPLLEPHRQPPHESAAASAEIALTMSMLRALRNTMAVKRVVRTQEGESSADEYERHVGSAVYLFGSMANHSCVPNAVATFVDGANLTLRLVKPVQSGSEVTISYGPTDTRIPSREVRRQILQDKWDFCCRCGACETERSSTFPNPRASFKCTRFPKCQYPVPETNRTCPSCGEKLNMDLRQQVLARAIPMSNPSMTSLPSLLAAHRDLSLILHPANLVLARLSDRIGRLYAERKELSLAWPFVWASAQVVGQVFGQRSLEYCREVVKLCAIAFGFVGSQKSARGSTESGQTRTDVPLPTRLLLDNLLAEGLSLFETLHNITAVNVKTKVRLGERLTLEEEDVRDLTRMTEFSS
ncbi:hypothetical protein M427DRAFT_53695 [Gonapodya prolifera JEL478]|uniref:SET domain-containing protein n=1 Tax=Gonapodya prolifera (strain JEL478) TaxID=1344416 RepID=A0A139APV2_GONPJ|nr:hypothetical protein M427DRAFT_53695 [Gonapodya prolifera JEL478]|eukprot:KXS18766.1 hypothetical protein M427DRAFT_53695 [Gonapodya prolifera JEL478]